MGRMEPLKGNRRSSKKSDSHFHHHVPDILLSSGCREVNLKGIATPRGSLQNSGGQTLRHEGDQLTEVTCDKAPLTKHEWVHSHINCVTNVIVFKSRSSYQYCCWLYIFFANIFFFPLQENTDLHCWCMRWNLKRWTAKTDETAERGEKVEQIKPQGWSHKHTRENGVLHLGSSRLLRCQTKTPETLWGFWFWRELMLQGKNFGFFFSQMCNLISVCLSQTKQKKVKKWQPF